MLARRTFTIGCLVAVGSIVLLIVALVWPIFSNEAENKAKALEAELKQEVPLGSDREAIVSWFEKKGFSYSFMSTDPVHLPGRLNRPHYRTLLIGISSTITSETHLWIYVFVDDQGRAIDHEVEPWLITL